MKKIKLALASFMFVALGAAAVLMPTTNVGAVNALEDACNSSNSTADNPVCSTSGNDAPTFIKTLTDVLLFIVGALSVVMLIWGGIRYTTSAGNASSVAAAKNTIMYAVIGLIISLLAYAIVTWVVKVV